MRLPFLQAHTPDYGMAPDTKGEQCRMSEQGIYTDEASERIYQTVTYQCGHTMLRATFRKQLSLDEVADMPRELVNGWQDCRHCQDRRLRALERQAEKRGAA